ncbi:MAG: 50S ribosomal protein L13 [Terriglobia bacterium]
MSTYMQGRKRGRVRWVLINAEGWPLGRLAARASMILMGKDCADFTPHEDHRDGLIIVNSEKIVFTGRKLDQKLYRRHSGYPGGLKEVTARKLMETKPEAVIHEAVRGMLPKTRLGDRMAARLKVYAGPNHPHAVQKPVDADLRRKRFTAAAS